MTQEFWLACTVLLVVAFLIAREIVSFYAWLRTVRRRQEQNHTRYFAKSKTYLSRSAALSD